MSRKVVLITGTNSGFGWRTVQGLAAKGHSVYATMRDVAGTNAAKAKELAGMGDVTVLDVSLTDENSIKAAFDALIAKEGRIDVLVNNAGSALFGVAETATAEDVQRLFEINVLAPWRLIRHALPFMRRQAEGLIVNVSSGWGRFAAPFMGVYSASKFALEGLSEGLHYEVRPLGVDVAIVQPGAFPTEMGQKTGSGSDAAIGEEYGAIAAVPEQLFAAIGRMFETVKPDPQEVADAVLRLVDLPKGQRPLRTVVDRATGHITAAANEAVKAQYDQVLTAFGMQELLT